MGTVCSLIFLGLAKRKPRLGLCRRARTRAITLQPLSVLLHHSVTERTMRFWLRVSEGELPDRCNGDGGRLRLQLPAVQSSSNALMANASPLESQGELQCIRQQSKRCNMSAGQWTALLKDSRLSTSETAEGWCELQKATPLA